MNKRMISLARSRNSESGSRAFANVCQLLVPSHCYIEWIFDVTKCGGWKHFLNGAKTFRFSLWLTCVWPGCCQECSGGVPCTRRCICICFIALLILAVIVTIIVLVVTVGIPSRTPGQSPPALWGCVMAQVESVVWRLKSGGGSWGEQRDLYFCSTHSGNEHFLKVVSDVVILSLPL